MLDSVNSKNRPDPHSAYTDKYARWLSTEATPGPGKECRFTESDLKLIAYIYQQTAREGQTHEQVEAQLAAGALDAFGWETPETATSAPETPGGDTSALLSLEVYKGGLGAPARRSAPRERPSAPGATVEL